jgi:hypothetical protein
LNKVVHSASHAGTSGLRSATPCNPTIPASRAGKWRQPEWSGLKNEFDHVAAGIAKTRQLAHVPRCACLLGANNGFDAVPRQFGDGSIELRPAMYLEADGTFRGFTEKEDQRVIAHVGAKASGVFTPVDQLQPKNALAEIDGRGKVACPKANVSKLVDRDHAWHILGLEITGKPRNAGLPAPEGPDFLFASLVGSLIALNVSNSTL